jgi:prepilin-type processing-associated H-X9-DG protein
MKQLGTAVMMYGQDYDEVLPAWPFDATPTGLFRDPCYKVWSYGLWLHELQPYVKNTAVFACPSGPKSGANYVFGPKDGRILTNYGINEHVNNWNNGFAPLARLAAAPNGPSEVTIIAESSFGGAYQDWSDNLNIPGRGKNFGLYRMYCANGASNTICVGRHKGHGVNACYCDGHSKFIPGERIQGGVEVGREYPIVNPNLPVWQ